MKQTAVEWLEQQMRSKATFIATPKNENEYVIETSVFREIINQAKAMEEENTINFALQHMFGTTDVGINLKNKYVKKYNDTFK